MNRTEENDQLTQVLDAIEHPEHYTDAQLQKLLGNEESRDYYRLMSETASAFAVTHTSTEEEVEAEWQRFRRQHIAPQHLWRKIAAVFIGLLLLSGITYAAVSLIRQHETTPQPSATEQTHASVPQQAASAQEEEPTDTAYVFKDAELQDILTELADHYRLHTEYRNEQARHTRLYIKWNKTENAQAMIERLNRFEKVNITLVNDIMIAE